MEKLYAAVSAALAQAVLCLDDGRVTLKEGLTIAVALIGAAHVYTATNSTRP